jgi:anthranilate/para-aminobenzoate synthase component I
MGGTTYPELLWGIRYMNDSSNYYDALCLLKRYGSKTCVEIRHHSLIAYVNPSSLTLTSTTLCNALEEIEECHNEGITPIVGYITYEALASTSNDATHYARAPLSLSQAHLPPWAFARYQVILQYDFPSRTWDKLTTFNGQCAFPLSTRFHSVEDIRSRWEEYSNFSLFRYQKSVEYIKESIREGQYYQVNLSQLFSRDMTICKERLGATLLHSFPSPHAKLLTLDTSEEEITIISNSPETFFEIASFNNTQRISCMPIKGTAPREASSRADSIQKQQLLMNEKDGAELSMIVDLTRNDLYQICHSDSVKVKEHRVVKTFPTVHHLQSTLEGILLPSTSLAEVMKALGPFGSISGAPKSTALYAISLLEQKPRGAFTGTIGVLLPDGTATWSVGIRTASIYQGTFATGVGGGITLLSNALDEYKETLWKLRAFDFAWDEAQIPLPK